MRKSYMPTKAKTDDHATPRWLFRALDDEFRFTLDVAASAHNAKCEKYFDAETMRAFGEWNRKVFAEGKLDKKTKELVAVACTYLTRCPYCIVGHTKAALKAGATKEEVAEVIQIAAALNAGAAIAHRNFALDVEE